MKGTSFTQLSSTSRSMTQKPPNARCAGRSYRDSRHSRSTPWPPDRSLPRPPPRRLSARTQARERRRRRSAGSRWCLRTRRHPPATARPTARSPSARRAGTADRAAPRCGFEGRPPSQPASSQPHPWSSARREHRHGCCSNKPSLRPAPHPESRSTLPRARRSSHWYSPGPAPPYSRHRSRGKHSDEARPSATPAPKITRTVGLVHRQGTLSPAASTFLALAAHHT